MVVKYLILNSIKFILISIFIPNIFLTFQKLYTMCNMGFYILHFLLFFVLFFEEDEYLFLFSS